MQVLGNRVLVELEKASKEVETVGGIFLPEGSQAAKIEIGMKVIEVGSEVVGIKKGDHILVEPRAGIKMLVEEGSILFVHVNQILCVL